MALPLKHYLCVIIFFLMLSFSFLFILANKYIQCFILTDFLFKRSNVLVLYYTLKT